VFQWFYVYPPLALAQGAFMVWMLVDAQRRRAEPFWFWVILIVPVVGAWAYFFSVKAPTMQGQSFSLGTLFQRQASLEELRYRAEQTPTLANHLALAERLMDRGEHAEALSHLEAARKLEPEHCQVVFGLAVCHCEDNHANVAVPLLEDIVHRNPTWSDGAAWRQLIRARLQCGDHAGALADCRELARRTPTLQNRCILAERLLEEGFDDEARSLLEQSLRDHEFAPGPIRRKNRPWASIARRLQKKLPAR
jgi:hypothetical protein